MKKFLIAFSILILAAIFSFLIFLQLSSPVSNQDNHQAFVINKGDGFNLIANRLKQSGFIKNETVFKINAYLLGLHSKLRAGTFNLSSNMNNAGIIRLLTTGGSIDNWIQLLEGWRNEEIATYLDENSFYSGKSFLFLTEGKQGYIFPDTYSIPKDKDVQFFIDKTLENFNQKYQQASQNSTPILSQTEIITLASLLEREANNLEAKKMVAGIIYNRLSIDMALQIDATVQYALDSLKSPQKYWQPISKADLAINHPYNTYQNPGLPPGPICNPSYNAIVAALNPTDSDFLYYITGTNGQMYYAKTLDEHNQNITKYLR